MSILRAGDSALAHLSNALDDLQYSPDQRPVPLIREAMADVRAMLESSSAPFQAGVTAWMGECFPPDVVHNPTERGDRLLEEVLELLQSHGYDRGRVATLVEYVYGRPVGEPAQEVGGVMVTLAAYCMVAGLDMHAEGDRELARITQPEVIEKIRRKQEAKRALHFDTPLPGAAGRSVGNLAAAANLYQQETGQELDPRAFCRAVELYAAAPQQPPPVGDRFFIDHGIVHDRQTGKHVGDDAEALLALLHRLEQERDAWRMTAKAVTVTEEMAAAALSGQPPPVGVTDAMVERARNAYKATKRYHTGDYPEGSIRSVTDMNRNDDDAWRTALTAALSQQEAAPSVSFPHYRDGPHVSEDYKRGWFDGSSDTAELLTVSEPAASDGQRAVEEYERARRLTTTGQGDVERLVEAAREAVTVPPLRQSDRVRIELRLREALAPFGQQQEGAR